VKKRNSSVNKESCRQLEPIKSSVTPFPPANQLAPNYSAGRDSHARLGREPCSERAGRGKVPGRRCPPGKRENWPWPADDFDLERGGSETLSPKTWPIIGPASGQTTTTASRGTADRVSHRSIASRSTRHVRRRPALDMQNNRLQLAISRLGRLASRLTESNQVSNNQ
jgi:hypothetical protein